MKSGVAKYLGVAWIQQQNGLVDEINVTPFAKHMKALSTTEAGYMTFTEAWKKEIRLKGLLTELVYELRLVAGIATSALVKGCAESLKAILQHMKALSTTEAGYMTFTEACKKEIKLKGLLTELAYELRLVAGIATSALVKGCSRSEVPA
nr:retrotransposon protein, putative, Ty1-copia subclass [Tanacetum cinerariifolium]